MVQTLRDVWRGRDDAGRARWRSGAELPPIGERLQSPYDPEVHYSTKRQMEAVLDKQLAGVAAGKQPVKKLFLDGHVRVLSFPASWPRAQKS